MPVEVKNTQLEVLVVFQPITTPQKGKAVISQRWPPDFFDKTWGICADSPIVVDEAGISAELDDKGRRY